MVGYLDAFAADPVLTRLVEKDRVPWYNKPNLRALYALMIPVCMGVEWTSGFDSAMMNGIQTVENWKIFFNTPGGPRLGFMIASYALGGILVMPLVPFVGDRWGRRMSIIIGSLVMVVGAIIQAAAQNFEMFVLGRIILGMGIPFSLVAASSLVGELSYPKERPILTSLFTVSGLIGGIAAAGSTLGTFAMTSSWSWRIPSALQLVPTAFQLAFIWWIPESPRWLILKGRDEEAMAILVKYHAEDNPSSKFAMVEFAQIQATIAVELENNKMTWRQYFSTAANRRRALIALCIGFFAQASGNSPLYFYLVKILIQVGITSDGEQNAFNMGVYCWALVSALFCALVVRRFRRRVMFLTSVIGMLSAYIILTVSAARYDETKTKMAGSVALLAIMLYIPFYSMGFIALPYTYLVEVFPFTVRAKGIAMEQWWVRASSFINTFVSPIGMEALKWRFYIFYCCWISFEALCIYLLFPETSGRTLEELAFLFEGQEGQEASQEVQKRMENILDAEKVVYKPKHANVQVEEV